MNSELLPCPFCGKEPKSKFSMSTRSKIWCPECAVEMRAVESYPVWHTDDFLVSTWNARAAATDGQFARAIHDGRAWEPVRTCRWELAKRGTVYDVYGCSACGYEYAEPVTDGGVLVSIGDAHYCPHCGAKVVE